MFEIKVNDPLRDKIVEFFKWHFNNVDFDFRSKRYSNNVKFVTKEFGELKIEKNAALTFYISGPGKAMPLSYSAFTTQHTLRVEIVNGSNSRYGYVVLTEEEFTELAALVNQKYELKKAYDDARREYEREQEKVREWEADQKALEFLRKEMKETFDGANV